MEVEKVQHVAEPGVERHNDEGGWSDWGGDYPYNDYR